MVRANDTPIQEHFKQEISQKLKALISSRGITQTELAEKTGIPKTTINGYVKGTSLPTPGNTEKLAQALNTTKAEIDPRFRTQLPSSNNPDDHLSREVSILIEQIKKLSPEKQEVVIKTLRMMLD